MSSTLVATLGMAFTPPGGSPSNCSFKWTVPYDALELGSTDVPAETPDCTEFTVALGGVDKPAFLALVSTLDVEIDVTIDCGSEPIRVAAGGGCMPVAGVLAPCDPIGELKFKTKGGATGSSIGRVYLFAFGPQLPMPWTAAIEPAASAARVASGVGSSLDLGVCTTARLDLAVTAAAGIAPSLVVTVETSKDGAVWRTLGAFAAVSAAGALERRFPSADRYLRVRWAVSGAGASFTFSASGERVLVYATPQHFDELGINPAAFEGISPEQKDKWLVAASDDADGLLEAGKTTLPLRSWGDDLRQRIVDMAVFRGMKRRGFNPVEGSPDKLVLDADTAARKWLADVRDEKIMPQIVDSTPAVYEGGATVISRARRGWGS